MGTEGRQAWVLAVHKEGTCIPPSPRSHVNHKDCLRDLQGRKQEVLVQEEAEGDLTCLVMGRKWQVWALGQRALGEERRVPLRENQDDPAGVPHTLMLTLPLLLYLSSNYVQG